MKQQYEIRRLSLEEQRSRMQQQLDTFREELTAKLNIANQEVHKHTLLYSKHGAEQKFEEDNESNNMYCSSNSHRLSQVRAQTLD